MRGDVSKILKIAIRPVQLLIVVAQRQLRELPIRNVNHRSMKIRGVARAVGLDAPPRLQPPECSVALPDPIFNIVSAAELDRALEGVGDTRAIFLMNDLQIR